ncbi:MAG: MucR family transcriptional regulator, partial [Sphingomicrobium sp.]
SDLVELATELTIAWLGNPNNRASVDEVPTFLRAMHAAVRDLSQQGGSASAAESRDDTGSEHVPAVTARKSLSSRDHIISLIDGKAYKTLRRHLSTHGLTPTEYRTRYKLKPDYPMVAPTYSEQRRAMAVKIGLGSKGRAARAEGTPATQKPARAPRAKTA